MQVFPMYVSSASRVAVFALCAVLLAPLGARTARAAIIATQSVAEPATRDAALIRIQRRLDDERVSRLLQQRGVARGDIDERLAGMTDREIADFADRLDQAPAGGDFGFFGVIGVVFVVLLILELVGVIDIFKHVGPVRR